MSMIDELEFAGGSLGPWTGATTAILARLPALGNKLLFLIAGSDNKKEWIESCG